MVPADIDADHCLQIGLEQVVKVGARVVPAEPDRQYRSVGVGNLEHAVRGRDQFLGVEGLGEQIDLGKHLSAGVETAGEADRAIDVVEFLEQLGRPVNSVEYDGEDLHAARADPEPAGRRHELRAW